MRKEGWEHSSRALAYLSPLMSLEPAKGRVLPSPLWQKQLERFQKPEQGLTAEPSQAHPRAAPSQAGSLEGSSQGTWGSTGKQKGKCLRSTFFRVWSSTQWPIHLDTDSGPGLSSEPSEVFTGTACDCLNISSLLGELKSKTSPEVVTQSKLYLQHIRRPLEITSIAMAPTAMESTFTGEKG